MRWKQRDELLSDSAHIFERRAGGLCFGLAARQPPGCAVAAWQSPSDGTYHEKATRLSFWIVVFSGLIGSVAALVCYRHDNCRLYAAPFSAFDDERNTGNPARAHMYWLLRQTATVKSCDYRLAFNLTVVMLLGGLRHGAAWGFVVWGAIHGVRLGAGRVFRSLTGVNPDRDEQPAVSRIVRILVTFHLVAGCLVVFRAQDWDVIQDYFTTLAAVRPGSVELTPIAMAVLMVTALWEVMPRSWITRVAVTLIRLPSPVQTGAVTVCLLVFAALGGASPPFIYFQF